MPVEIKAISDSIKADKGTVVSWEKQEGEKVVKDDVIVLVETEKVIVEITSPADGIIAKILVQATEEFDMKQPLGIITGEGEELDLSGVGSSADEVEPEQGGQEETISVSDGPVLVVGNGLLAQLTAEQVAKQGFQVLFSTGGEGPDPGYFHTLVALKKILRELQCFKTSSFIRMNESAPELFSWDAVKDYYQQLESLQKTERVRLESMPSIEFIGNNVALTSESEVLVRYNDSETREIFFGSAILAVDPRAVSISEDLYRCVFNAETIWNMKRRPRKILISGATPVGIGFAALFSLLGSDVTIVEEADSLDLPNDPELIEALVKQIENSGIELRFSSSLESIKTSKTGVSATLSSMRSGSLWNGDAILLSGFDTHELFTDLNLEKVGIKRHGKMISTDSCLKTPKGNVFVIGLPDGRIQTVQTGLQEIQVALSNIAGRTMEIDFSHVPLTVDFIPSLASIGLTEEQARNACPGFSVIREDRTNLLSINGKPSGGLIKLIIEPDSGEILGAHLFMENAEELIGEVSLALRAEATIEELADCTKPFLSNTGFLTEIARA